MIYTNKQRELMRRWQRNELRRINLLEGSVSSGKTWISLVLWGFWTASMPQDKLYLMCAKSLTTLKRNCLIPLEELVGANNFTFSIPAKEGYLFGRRILLEGANDARSESKIRGLSLQGAYCDELTQFPEDFFAMLLSRLRLPAAKLIATTNPDTPHHWLKAHYLDRADELDMLDEKFLITDNTTLDPEYVANVMREYTGVFYERFILGRWKAAEGAIYRDFADDPARFILDAAPEDIIFGTMGLDFGGNGSAHAGCLVGFTRGLRQVIVLAEYYRKEVISPEQLCDDVCAFIERSQQTLCSQRRTRAGEIYCDSAETVLIKGVQNAVARRRIPVEVKKARKGEITDRIRLCSMLMAQGRFFVMRGCTRTIEALSEALWDGKSPTKDKRLDDGTTNIDSLDALEYALEPHMNDLIRTGGIHGHK